MLVTTSTTNELFTASSIATFGAATAAVTVVASALYKLAKLPPKWTGFAASIVIAYGVVIASSPHWLDWVLGFFNACLLYCSSLGANELGVVATSQPGKGFATTEGFFTPWFARSRRAPLPHVPAGTKAHA